jgi:hypothetical protein
MILVNHDDEEQPRKVLPTYIRYILLGEMYSAKYMNLLKIEAHSNRLQRLSV